MEKKDWKANLRLYAGKFWHLVWEDESALGWLVSLIFAFLVIKFIFFPVLSIIFGTSMPLVVVESGSMHHPGSYLGNYFGSDKLFEQWWAASGEWYTPFGIDSEQAHSWPLENGMEIGDVIIVWRAGDVEIGDIVIFNANTRYPIIHRVINITEDNNQLFYSTKGDNNAGQLSVEKRIPSDAVVGKAVFRVPWIGWIKLAFVKLFDFTQKS